MRFLADENIHADLVTWLRSRGHDVSYAAETMPSEPDESVLRRANGECRVLVTSDKDFGDLVVHRRLASCGVLLLRLRSPSMADRIRRLEAIWRSIEERLQGSFTVVGERRVRVRTIPATGGKGSQQ
jgi:predicted nuclease of predicted toxin-antitoxin system